MEIYSDDFRYKDISNLYAIGTIVSPVSDSFSSCFLYVACGSSCMLCNTSGYTCNSASCYSKVYKF